MRVDKETASTFWGTHKGAEIQIDRDPDGTFYIIVTARNGGTLYNGWAPRDVVTMAQAKRQAVKGACLDRPKPPRRPKMLHGLPVAP